MMFARYLSSASQIMQNIGGQPDLANNMSTLASQLRSAISSYGIVSDPKYGDIYAYEVDGYGSRNLMDDANIPSLLSAPFFGYLDMDDETYQATRQVLLSANNPYFMRGPVINAIGGAHDGPGFGWPMASIVRIFTSDNDTEITTTLKELVSSTDGLGRSNLVRGSEAWSNACSGLIHESINTFDQSDWTRQWFVAPGRVRLTVADRVYLGFHGRTGCLAK